MAAGLLGQEVQVQVQVQDLTRSMCCFLMLNTLLSQSLSSPRRINGYW